MASSAGVVTRSFSGLSIAAVAAIFGNSVVHWFKTQTPPTKLSPVSGFVEADFAGYHPFAITAFEDAAFDADNVAFIMSGLCNPGPANAGGPLNSLYGAWIESEPLTYTDLVIGAVGHETEVSSVAHPFIAGDLGRTLTITSGTGFTPGSYTIISVAGGVATLSSMAGVAASTAGHAGLRDTYPLVAGLFVAPVSIQAPGDDCPTALKLRSDGTVLFEVAQGM